MKIIFPRSVSALTGGCEGTAVGRGATTCGGRVFVGREVLVGAGVFVAVGVGGGKRGVPPSTIVAPGVVP